MKKLLLLLALTFLSAQSFAGECPDGSGESAKRGTRGEGARDSVHRRYKCPRGDSDKEGVRCQTR